VEAVPEEVDDLEIAVDDDELAEHCHQCGAQLLPENRFCVECGARI
jgi:uncharacterized OB-fold protein